MKQPRDKILWEYAIDPLIKIVTYAPTFDAGLFPWGNKLKQFGKLCNFCQRHGLILIVRLHPLTKNVKGIDRIKRKYDCVHWLDMNREPEMMKILAITDILITNWSSLQTEYYVKKGSIVYLEHEKDYYTKDRGHPVLLPEYRAGDIVSSSSELFYTLEKVLKFGNSYSGKQKLVTDMVFGEVDGQASKNVCSVINELLEEKK